MGASTNLEMDATDDPSDLAVVPGSSRGRLLRAGATIAAAIAIANLLQGVLQFALARVLAPEAYSALVSLFVIVTICSVPTLGIQAAVAREVATYDAVGDTASAGAVLVDTLRSLVRAVAVAAVLGAAIGIPVALALHVQRPAALAAAGVAVLATAAMPVAWGGLQGQGRFRALAGAQVLWAALRFVLAFALAAAGYGIGGAMSGVAVATLVVLAGALLMQRPLLAAAQRGRRAARVRFAGGYAVGAAASLCAFTALTSLDVPVARLALSPFRAGAYSAASVAARALLVAAIAATTVLFPRVATLADRRRQRRHLRAGLLVVGTVGAIATAVAASVPRLLLRLAFGSEYTHASAYLGLLVLALALYGLVYVYTYHFLSLSRLWFTAVLGAALVAQLGLYTAFHADGRQLALVQVGCAATLVVLAEIFELTVRK